MSTFLVERYLPGASAGEVRSFATRFQAQIERVAAEGISIRYLGSTFVPGEESCFCRFEGPSQEAIARINHMAGIPFARIMSVVDVHPAHAGSSTPIVDGMGNGGILSL